MNANEKIGRILLSNDDGIYAPGLTCLEKIADRLSDDVWVVAPETEQSGASHSLTLHSPLRIIQHAPKKYHVTGTPTDCILLGNNKILPKINEETFVFSGVNIGENLGEDVAYSGTIAAAAEGTLLGRRSIAMSLSYRTLPEGKLHWKTAEYFMPDLIRKLITLDWPDRTLMNINIPSIPIEAIRGVKVVRQGRRKISEKFEEHHDPRGRTYYWIGMYDQEIDNKADTDLGAIKDNFITVTPISLDLTDYSFMEILKKKL